MGSGVVHIGEDWDPERQMFWTGRFSGHWESPEGEESIEGVSAEEAIEWGRARAEVVLIRPGDSDVHYSAGTRHPGSDLDDPILEWAPGTQVRPRWHPGYEHLGLEADEPIEWEAQLPVPDAENRTAVVVRARSHEEALPLAVAEWDRLRGGDGPRLRLRDRLRMLLRRGIHVEDTGFDAYDDLRPR